MAHLLTIALDGPAGSGKSTLARALARRLGYRYLDTGAMYRAVALVASRRGIEPEETGRLAALADAMVETLRIRARDDGPHVLVGEEDVSRAIRSEAVSRIVSRYASRPEVRRAMVRLQKAQRGEGGIVAEGRDIGTVVFPDADLKFYVTATLEERARRRLKDFGADETDRERLAEVLADIRNRDSVDSGREDSPLRPADDAETIDTTGLAVEEILDLMESRVRDAGGCSTRS